MALAMDLRFISSWQIAYHIWFWLAYYRPKILCRREVLILGFLESFVFCLLARAISRLLIILTHIWNWPLVLVMYACLVALQIVFGRLIDVLIRK